MFKMLTLDQCLKNLSVGVLSNISWGNDGNGSIRVDKVPTVVGHINEALLRLYTKFIIKKNTIFIELTESNTDYHLNSDHAWTNAPADSDEESCCCEYYIRDTFDNPFKNDVIKVLDVYSSTGHRLALNNDGNKWSVFTPVYDVLEVPNPVEGVALAVMYQASHSILDFDKNPKELIKLPPSLYGALYTYVAYLIYSDMNTQEAVVNAQKYLNFYNQIIQECIDGDILSTTYSQSNEKFSARGFI